MIMNYKHVQYSIYSILYCFSNWSAKSYFRYTCTCTCGSEIIGAEIEFEWISGILEWNLQHRNPVWLLNCMYMYMYSMKSIELDWLGMISDIVTEPIRNLEIHVHVPVKSLFTWSACSRLVPLNRKKRGGGRCKPSRFDQSLVCVCGSPAIVSKIIGPGNVPHSLHSWIWTTESSVRALGACASSSPSGRDVSGKNKRTMRSQD